MAKGKNFNPADAYRKAQRKKELAKNKEARKGAKEIATVKKDTSAFEEEIVKLLEQEKSTSLNAAQKSRLSDLQSEVSRINAAKDAFVEAHPEQRKLVFRARAAKPVDPQGGVKEDRSLFGKNGLPLHPERSVYYDSVMNPYGMPPPGMPYVERAPTPVEGEMDEEDEDEEDEDEDEEDEDEEDEEDDIPMPDTPPAGGDDVSDGEALENIPLPPGPPPGRFVPQPTLPPGPPPLPPGPPPGMQYTMHMLPQLHMQMPHMQMMAVPGYPAQATAFAVPVSYTSVAPATQLPPPPPSLPAPPRQEPLPPSAAAATISAPAALRDLKAEATAFVPSAVKRRKVAGGK